MSKLLTLGYKYSIPTIIILLLLSIYSGFLVKDLKSESAIKKLVTQKNSVAGNATERVLSIVVSDSQLFTPSKIELLKDFYSKLEQLEYIKLVESLTHSSVLNAQSQLMSLGTLIQEYPDKSELIKVIKSESEFARFISKDGRSLIINVYANFIDKEEIYSSVATTIENYKNDFEDISQVGLAPLTHQINQTIIEDLAKIFPLVFFIMIIFFLVSLNSFTLAIIPLITGSLSLLFILAMASFNGMAIGPLTMIIPLVILIIGSTEDIHLISEFQEALAMGHNHDGAVKFMARKLSLPLILTTITTLVGFSAILSNEIIILREFAYLSITGIIVNFIVTALFIPAYLKHIPTLKSRGKDSKSSFDMIGDKFFHLTKKRRKPLMITIVLVMAALSTQIHKVDVDNNSFHFFSKNTQALNKDFDGAYPLEVSLTSSQSEGFKDKHSFDILLAIHQLPNQFENIKSAQSLASFFTRELQSKLQADDLNDSTLPKEIDKLEINSKNEITPYMDPEFRQAKIIFRHNIDSSAQSLDFYEKLQEQLEKITSGSSISYQLSGYKYLADQATKSLLSSQYQSLLIALGIVFVIISILFFDIKMAVISIIPSLIPIITFFAIMGILEIPLNIGTGLIAAIAVGITADDTIHFYTRFNQNMKIHYNRSLAIHETLKEEMRPLLITALTIVVGFSTFSLSSFLPVKQFGLLLSTTLTLGVLSNILVNPMLLKIFKTRGFVSLMEILSFDVKEEVFKESEFFSGISPVMAKKIIINGKIQDVCKDDFIGQKSLNKSLYLLLEGNVMAVKSAQRQNDLEDEVQISQYLPGSIFGSIQTEEFKGPVLESRIDCQSPCKFLVISPRFIDEIKNFSPEIEQTITKNINHILKTSILI